MSPSTLETVVQNVVASLDELRRGKLKDLFAADPYATTLTQTRAEIKKRAPKFPGGEEALAAFEAGQADGPQRLAGLLKAVASKDPMVFDFLLTVRHPREIEGLLAAAKDKYAHVRAAAIRKMANFDDPRSLDAVAEAYRDPSREVWETAVAGLHGIYKRIGLKVPEVRDKIVQMLADLLRHKDAGLRRRAMQMTGFLVFDELVDGSRCPPPLVEALKAAMGDRDPEVRSSAVRNWGNLAQARPELRGLLADRVRRGASDAEPAARALMESTDPRGIGFFTNRLRSKDPKIILAALRALFRHSTRLEVTLAAVPFLAHKNKSVRKEAESLVSAAEDPAAFAALRGAFENPRIVKFARCAALKGVARLPSPEAFSFVRGVLEGEKDPELRLSVLAGLHDSPQASVLRLKALSTETRVPTLIRVVRCLAVARANKMVRMEDLIAAVPDFIRRGLRPRSAALRTETLHLLSSLTSPEIAPAIQSVIDDPSRYPGHEGVRRTAQEVLKKVAGRDRVGDVPGV